MAGSEQEVAPLDERQFAALSELLRLRDSPAREGARLVLIEGAALSEAARAAGTGRQNVYRAVQACRRGIELARAVCGIRIEGENG